MGCLKNVTRAVFLTVLIAGFIALGGKDMLWNKVKDYLNPSKDVVIERAQKIGDFSKINKEFEIEKAAAVLGYSAVLAEHKASGQKMLVVDSGKKVLLTQEDIIASDTEDRILSVIKKIKYQSAAVEEFHVIEKGSMHSYGKDIPYAKFRARLKKVPIGEISGIISVVKDEKGNDKVLVSVNEKDRYSQLISNEFFKEIK